MSEEMQIKLDTRNEKRMEDLDFPPGVGRTPGARANYLLNEIISDIIAKNEAAKHG
jgi:hypothetical protein